MKEFDIEKVKAGYPVCTRAGLPVRVICTDANTGSDSPVVALVKRTSGTEEVICYNKNGRLLKSKASKLDLFMAAIKRVGWVNIYSDGVCRLTSHVFASCKEALDESMQSSNYITTIRIQWEE